MNEYINLNEENVEREHICCAISDKKHQEGVNKKKEWIKERIKEGHIFRKLNVQGKVFIEFAPLEKAWVPIDGENFVYIYCLWVAGSFKGKGYAKELVEYAIAEARKNKKSGLCVMTSKKKKPFMSEKKFFEKYGFELVDSIGEYELLALSFDGSKPCFRNCARTMSIASKEFTIYYSEQCPFTSNCITELEEYSKKNEIRICFVKVDTLEKAKNVPCVFNNWATFKDGKYVSNALLNANLVEKLLKN